MADPLHSLTEHHPAPDSSFPPPLPQLWSHPTTEPREKSRVPASSVPARPLRSGTPASSPKRCGCSVEGGIGFLTRCGNRNLMTSCMSAHRKTTKEQRSGSISCSFFLCCNQTKEIAVTNTLESNKTTCVTPEEQQRVCEFKCPRGKNYTIWNQIRTQITLSFVTNCLTGLSVESLKWNHKKRMYTVMMTVDLSKGAQSCDVLVPESSCRNHWGHKAALSGTHREASIT